MSGEQAPADAKRQRIQKLPSILEKLSEGQLFWLEKVINIFDVPGQYQAARSNLITEEVLHDFGDALKIHHAFSIEIWALPHAFDKIKDGYPRNWEI